MSWHWIYIAHVAMLGYWLGAELVINSAFRRAALESTRPFDERDRLMDLVMDADQHVRRALLLQLIFGTLLMMQRGYLPLMPSAPTAAMSLVVAIGVVWLVLVELTHRRRKQLSGLYLASVDRGLRYLMIGLLFVAAWLGWRDQWPIPDWLAVKLILFAAVMIGGVLIRLILIQFFHVWQRMAQSGSEPVDEQQIRRAYFQSTGVLMCLWAAIAGMVGLSVVN